MDNTGKAVSKELADLKERMKEWGPVQQKILVYVNSHQLPMSEEEIVVAEGLQNFIRIRDEVVRRIEELMRDVQEFGDDEVPIQLLERKNQIFQIFDEASVTLAETNLMHREQTTLTRDFCQEITQALLDPLSELQNISTNILGTLQGPNNDQSLRAQTKLWKEMISRTWSALTDIRIQNYRLQRNQLEQLNALLTHVEELHCPPWYFQFVISVGQNAIEETQQFRGNLTEYKNAIEGLYTEIDQFLGY